MKTELEIMVEETSKKLWQAGTRKGQLGHSVSRKYHWGETVGAWNKGRIGDSLMLAVCRFVNAA